MLQAAILLLNQYRSADQNINTLCAHPAHNQIHRLLPIKQYMWPFSWAQFRYRPSGSGVGSSFSQASREKLGLLWRDRTSQLSSTLLCVHFISFKAWPEWIADIPAEHLNKCHVNSLWIQVSKDWLQLPLKTHLENESHTPALGDHCVKVSLISACNK